VTTADEGVATLQQFEAALIELDSARYELTLYVTGASALSARAVADVHALCETYLHDRYRLEVVDVRRDPMLTSSKGVVASPTLIKDYPLPKRILVGDLSNAVRVLHALDIVPIAEAELETS
jgi:circadian clock protein KaiB